ncbi:MAG: ADP-ribosylglycohydrolase family protein [Armatimonadetes bacterium]|nr:ADP-ribosylglycohydrolase family protein [Armatimonadota bacterium]
MKHIWLYLRRSDLDTERRQCKEEGKDLAPVVEEFERVAALDLEDPRYQPAAQALLDRTAALPLRPDYPYEEPSDLEGIRAVRPARRSPLPVVGLSDAALEDRIYGAWLGRVCGCLLGKPVEGWRRPQMYGYLRETGRFPLSWYFSRRAPEDVRKRYGIRSGGSFIEDVRFMPEDDDTNYTTTGLGIWKRYGSHFTPVDVASFWMSDIPILRTCTAERVAYRNLALLIPPPQSASFRNPYREWIGAQIRADFWGYVAAGNPERAARYAWRAACISHVKNGIYGAMFCAAVIAAAFVTSDLDTMLDAGLGEIPARCRLAEAIRAVRQWRAAGLDYDAALERLHQTWDERCAYDWCHTISNAMVVVLGLLWGEHDYPRSITRAVQACFDTDCNGATVGSILGAMQGARELPAAWTEVVRDTLVTGVAGYHRVRISKLARETARCIEQATNSR